MNETTGSPAPHFGAAYDKARKAYGLASGLLLAWELIGVDFTAKPLENLNITLKSPQAIPYVLIALVAYFAFRITIEWYQAEPARRRLMASRADFAVAHIIGAAAILLYAVQAILRVQLANKIQPEKLTVFMIGWALGFATGTAIEHMIEYIRSAAESGESLLRRAPLITLGAGLVSFAVFVWFLIWTRGGVGIASIGFAVGVGSSLLLLRFLIILTSRLSEDRAREVEP
jgi:hypothetical protein